MTCAALRAGTTRPRTGAGQGVCHTSSSEIKTVFRRFSESTKEMIREQLEFRELLMRMTMRDLVLRYKQSMMGFGWAIFMPLLNTILFSMVFTRIARVETPVAYPLFAYLGLTAWNLTASALRFSALSLTSNTSLVTKVYFPREVFPFSAVLVAIADAAVAAIVLVGMMLYYGAPFHATLFLIPVVLAVQLIFTAALALLLAMANLFYRDVKYVFEILVTVGMFASAVVYPVDGIGGRLGLVLNLNPMTQIIAAYRSLVFAGTVPDMTVFAVTAAGSLALLVATWTWFHACEYRFAENI
jgi:lipopolysaccharide transport system permease protein